MEHSTVTEKIEVRVTALVEETTAIRRIELQPLARSLPPFTAGSHIDLHLPNSLSRSYSLLNSQDERHRYVIGVSLEPQSRGGSRYIHEQLRIGERLIISPPRNLFALNEGASNSILIGGGIGVTPMLSMAKRLDALQRPWHLYYCCRSRSVAAFLDDLAPYGAYVDVRLDDEHREYLDIGKLMRVDSQTHFYCCGPQPMMVAFEAAANDAALPSAQKHVEYFQAQGDRESRGGFHVELARSGQSLFIPRGKTILETLQGAGIVTTSSCEVGICGECQVKVLEGIPDHQDSVLSDSERATNTSMMICCSGSRSEKLVLDL
jgi:tetrachlorobenzoquinone reductase